MLYYFMCQALPSANLHSTIYTFFKILSLEHMEKEMFAYRFYKLFTEQCSIHIRAIIFLKSWKFMKQNHLQLVLGFCGCQCCGFHSSIFKMSFGFGSCRFFPVTKNARAKDQAYSKYYFAQTIPFRLCFIKRAPHRSFLSYLIYSNFCT